MFKDMHTKNTKDTFQAEFGQMKHLSMQDKWICIMHEHTREIHTLIILLTYSQEKRRQGEEGDSERESVRERKVKL